MLFRRCPVFLVSLATGLALAAVAPPAGAHDDIAFGPASTLILSAPGFVTLQGFSRRAGTSSRSLQESTAVVSAAASPFTDVPLSFVLTLPATAEAGAVPSRSGVENVIVGARYRFEIPALRQAMHSDDDFFLAMLALEPPTGNVGYAPLKGPFNTHFAVLASATWRPFSFNAFFYYRYLGVDSQGTKRGNVSVTGASAAYAIVDRGRSALSVQLALLEETHFHNVITHAQQPGSGGTEILVSPAVVWMAHPRWQFFGFVALPVSQGLNAELERDRWRAGLGLVFFMGPLRVDPKPSEPPMLSFLPRDPALTP